jgi:hypothetical protein
MRVSRSNINANLIMINSHSWPEFLDTDPLLLIWHRISFRYTLVS